MMANTTSYDLAKWIQIQKNHIASIDDQIQNLINYKEGLLHSLKKYEDELNYIIKTNER